MTCTITIMRPGQEPETQKVATPNGYDQIAALVKPLVGGQIEHVTVLHKGRRHDMFVDEMGQYKDLPRNEEATRIYRNNRLTQHPETDPETLPYIYGPAVLFDTIVWR